LSIEWKHGECLITGGAGFLGSHLVTQLLTRYTDISIRVVARNENELSRLATLCPGDKRLILTIGDIRDIDTLGYILQGAKTIIHLAAMKHIDLCESNPAEAIGTNVYATENMLDMFEGDTFISMSTDKAVDVTGCYGATKLLLEKLTIDRALKYPGNGKRYMVVRSGNIFGSTGSVIPKWIQQIRQYNEITITDPQMTRFFIHVADLSSFIIYTIEQGCSGNVYIPDQATIRLHDLAKEVVYLYGNKDTKIRVTGLRSGEKLHERLFHLTESNIVTSCQHETSDKGVGQPDIIRSWLENYGD